MLPTRRHDVLAAAGIGCVIALLIYGFIWTLWIGTGL